MSTETILSANRDSVSARSTNGKEPEWMTKLRLEALELAAQLDLPKLEKTRIDRWKIDAYGEYHLSPQLNSLEDLPAEIKGLMQSQEHAGSLIVQRNSNVVYGQVSEELAKQGVIFSSLAEALNQHGDLIQKYFMSAVKKDENRLTALHAALWTGGIFIYVPKNVSLELPLQGLFYTDESNAAFSPHILIVAEANSRVTYVDNYISGKLNGELVHNGVVEIFAKQGAHVQFVSVHDLDEHMTDLNYRRAILDNDATMEWVVGEMNNGNCMSETSSVLQGNGSNSDAKVICVGSNAQKMNITTKAVHFGKSTTSNMITRAVMRDESTAIINGITIIEKDATNAIGEQTEKILMLSPNARGDANPVLLIDEDEVKANHAASVGQVNQDQIYYLMSRGIPKEQATELIVYGFLAPVVAKIPIAKLEDQFKGLVERKLGR